MKYLIMTEGTCELALLEVLIEKGLLKYSTEELLYEKCHHARQIKGDIVEMVNQLPFSEKITVIRVADKFADSFSISKIEERFTTMVKIRTSPEFEMLFIINEKLYSDFEKVKSKMKPSEFYKSKNHKYKKSKEFVYQYFIGLSSDDIIRLLKEYNKKRVRTFNKDEKTLLDLLQVFIAD